MKMKIFLIVIGFIVGNLFSHSYPDASNKIDDTVSGSASYVTGAIGGAISDAISPVDKEDVTDTADAAKYDSDESK